MSYYRREYSKSFGWGFLAVGIILLIVLYLMRSCASENIWNNGVCSYCGGHYKFQQAIGHNHYTGYMYICDKCGHSIEVAQHYPEVNNDI